MATIKLCLIDLDGTLIDTSRDIAAAANHVREAHDLPEAPLEVVLGWVGDGMIKLVERALLDLALSTHDQKRALSLCQAYYENHVAVHSQPYPGILECLDDLAPRTLVVLSNKPEKLCVSLLGTLGLSALFAGIHGPESFSEKKPSPVPVLASLETYDARSDQCVMIGDSPQDIESGIRAGVQTIGVTWGFRGRAELDRTQANAVVDSPDQIVHRVKALESS